MLPVRYVPVAEPGRRIQAHNVLRSASLTRIMTVVLAQTSVAGCVLDFPPVARAERYPCRSSGESKTSPAAIDGEIAYPGSDSKYRVVRSPAFTTTKSGVSLRRSLNDVLALLSQA